MLSPSSTTKMSWSPMNGMMRPCTSPSMAWRASKKFLQCDIFSHLLKLQSVFKLLESLLIFHSAVFTQPVINKSLFVQILFIIEDIMCILQKPWSEDTAGCWWVELWLSSVSNLLWLFKYSSFFLKKTSHVGYEVKAQIVTFTLEKTFGSSIQIRIEKSHAPTVHSWKLISVCIVWLKW